MGSSYATHAGMLSCASWDLINHLGHELNIPSLTYSATVTHCRKILGTACDYPATWNNATIVLYDDLIRGFHESKLFDDFKFTLF